MWVDLLFFVPLAIVTNTALPLSFDPVLLWFASRHDGTEACLFAALGSVAAGAAGVVDVRVTGVARRWRLPEWVRRFPTWHGSAFYVWAFLIALSPLPFSIVRVALIAERPHTMLYALSVAGGRLPRYLATVVLWQSLELPAWAGACVFLLAVVFAVVGRNRPC